MSCACCHGLSRRRFLITSAALGVLPLAACDDPPITLVDAETVERMGLESWQQIKATTQPAADPALDRLAERIAERLLRAAGQVPSQWEIDVFQGDQVNAFALPGRKIGVYTGMVGMAGSEDQLAAVIGHEIGHVLADHGQERVNSAALKDLGLNVVELALQLGGVEYSREIGAALGLGVEVGLALPYSRGHELEADRLGVQYMREAGYDPMAAVRLWERMAERADGGGPAFLSTHPAAADRAETLREIIGQA